MGGLWLVGWCYTERGETKIWTIVLHALWLVNTLAIDQSRLVKGDSHAVITKWWHLFVASWCVISEAHICSLFSTIMARQKSICLMHIWKMMRTQPNFLCPNHTPATSNSQLYYPMQNHGSHGWKPWAHRKNILLLLSQHSGTTRLKKAERIISEALTPSTERNIWSGGRNCYFSFFF